MPDASLFCFWANFAKCAAAFSISTACIESIEQGPVTEEINQKTNLVLLLDKIRVLSTGGRLLQAQELASSALSNLDKNEENEFYLRQIKAEETKLYFKLANEAMAEKSMS